MVNNPYSSFDTDKLDYLLRDTKHFGIPCNFDLNRIFQNCKIIENKLCLCDRIYSDIEKLFTIREELHETIYRHPTIEKFQDYFLVLLDHINISINSLDDFLELNDILLLMTLPKKEWKEFETRSWREFHSFKKKVEYKDEQKKRKHLKIFYGINVKIPINFSIKNKIYLMK